MHGLHGRWVNRRDILMHPSLNVGVLSSPLLPTSNEKLPSWNTPVQKNLGSSLCWIWRWWYSACQPFGPNAVSPVLMVVCTFKQQSIMHILYARELVTSWRSTPWISWEVMAWPIPGRHLWTSFLWWAQLYLCDRISCWCQWWHISQFNTKEFIVCLSTGLSCYLHLL